MPLLLRFAVLLIGACALSVPASAQCSFSLSPSSASFPAAGGNGVITITASAGTCARTAASNVSWVTISFGQTGTGSGTAGYTVLPNNTSSQRSGTLTVAGQTFTVTQAAGTCTYQLSPTSATVAAAGGSGSIEVTSACSWTASTAASWITLVGGSGAGDGTVGWVAAPNTSSSQRSGTITIGTTNFTLTQSGACVITLNPSTGSFTANGGNGNTNVNTSSSCDWTARSTVSWITITSSTSERGPAILTFTVAANQDRSIRIGTILVNDAVYTVSQAASTCTIILTPREAFIPVTGGSGTFSVTANCAWTVSTTANWVRIISPSSGSGSGTGTVSYEAGQNYSPDERGGLIQVGSTTFVVRQPGASCYVDLEANDTTIGASGGTGSLRISSLAGCRWTASASVDWIKITSTPTGIGEGEVSYSVDANPANQTRSGYIVIGSKLFQIVQAAAACSVSIVTRNIDVPAGGATGTIPLTANCSWQAASSAGWIQITSATAGSTSANLGYAVQANNTSDQRTGTITVNGQAVTFVQAGQRCSLSISSTSASLPARGGTGSVSVTGSSSCNWSATSSAEWLGVEWSSVSGSGVVRFSAEPNTSGSDRTAAIAVSGQTVTVRQPAIVLQISAAGVVNAASFQGGPISPGELVTIFGTGFGPTAIVGTQLTTDRRQVTKLLSDTRVLFDDVAAPMIYTSDGQLSAVVPYAVAGKQTASLQLEYLGVRSNAVLLQVAAAAPAIFTAGSTGRGQGSILNQDYSVNRAAAPAARGSIVQIYGTGEGQTRPAGVDGQLAAAPYPVPVQAISVLIGGVQAQVTYAGAAPGLVSGVFQVNARIPNDVSPGSEVPVVVRVGSIESPATVTLAVR